MVDTAPELHAPSPGDPDSDPAAGGGSVEIDPDHRIFEPASVRGPALIVLGIAVFIVVVGTVASALDSGSARATATRRVSIPDGTQVALTPASTALRSIVGEGQPPSDILGNLAVPTGSPVVRTVNADQGANQFDRTVYFTTRLSSSQVTEVYRTLLPKLGWKVIYAGDGAQRNSQQTEVLAKRGSGDGFYWEVGAVVSPTTAAGVTPYSLEVFELSDDS
jgi:hypothetical protein